MRKASLLAIIGLAAAVSAGPALAQTNPYKRGGPQPRESYGSYQSRQAYPGTSRVTNPYSVQPGYSGTIHWNTPNADGNLGGPGAGGSSGSSGG